MSFMAKIIRYLRWIFYSILSIVSLCAFIVIVMLFLNLKDLPRVPEPLSRIIETPPTEIFTATGERIMLIGGRETIPLDRVSPYFIQAVIATEDHRFWEHPGIDKIRTLKALWVTLFESGKIQGASTITQQLSKNLFFSFKRSYMRKFHELLVALQIESQYSKKEIFEAYINQIPFGVGAIGIERAARTFFGKPASDLTLSESAMLAGLPNAPTYYNPYLHLDRAKVRQWIVLMRMVAVSYITIADAEKAYQEELTLKKRTAGVNTGSYFIDTVIRKLETKYGPEVVFHGGLKIYTTLDPHMQSIAVESIKEGLNELDKILDIYEPGQDSNNHPQGALVAIESNTGAVKALVGGRDYFETEYNRAIQNKRQPGSGFKPFLYYAAFEKQGLNPATVFVDKPVYITIPGTRDWSPLNFERQYEGSMVLKNALMKSVNTIAAQLIQQVSPNGVIDVARRCGINSPLPPVYSLALGTNGVSPLEMSSAFATFATGGIQHESFWIQRVEDAQGRILEEHIVSGKRVLDNSITYQVVDMMRGVVESGTASVARRMGFDLPAAGKTGTTDGYRDAWFTGFTPTLCTSVWVGFDRNASLKTQQGVGITGGRGAVPIWADFMIKATQGEPQREFVIPDDIRFETIDPTIGCKINDSEPITIKVALRKDQDICEQIPTGDDLLAEGFIPAGESRTVGETPLIEGLLPAEDSQPAGDVVLPTEGSQPAEKSQPAEESRPVEESQTDIYIKTP
jgi:penicillin-binding protein 1A